MGFLSDIFTGKIFNRTEEVEKKPEQETSFEWKKEKGDSLSYGSGFSFGRKEFTGWRKIAPKESDGKFIAQRMHDGSLKKLFFQHYSFNKENSPQIVKDVIAGLPGCTLTELNLSGSLEKEDKVALMEALPKTNIRDLRISMHMEKDDLEMLSKTIGQMHLRRLEINDEFMTDQNIKPVLQNLPVGMEQLSLAHCRQLTDESAAELLPYVGRSNLQHISFMQTEVTDKHMPELLAKAQDPKTPPLYVETLWSKVSNEENLSAEFGYYRSQKRIHSIQTAQMTWVKNRCAVMDTIPHVSQARRDPDLMADYGAAGRLDEVLQRAIKMGRPITADELTAKQENRGSALKYAASRLELDKVFDSKCWTDAAEMQKAWDSLTSAKEKIQLDGKNGRPSFEARKQEVEKHSISTMVYAKSAQNDR